VREKQRDYIKNRLLHVDFLAVSLTEKIRTYVSVHFTGVSGAVKDFNAVLVKNLEELEVECLPTDLPERIDVDITPLAKPGDGIRVREVRVPDSIRLLNDPETMVAVATFAKVEEEVAPAVAAEGAAAVPTPTEPELSVAGRRKKKAKSNSPVNEKLPDRFWSGSFFYCGSSRAEWNEPTGEHSRSAEITWNFAKAARRANFRL
jgi:large subunit ribosomal protein L25